MLFKLVRKQYVIWLERMIEILSILREQITKIFG
jgi:hypothetical protein